MYSQANAVHGRRTLHLPNQYMVEAEPLNGCEDEVYQGKRVGWYSSLVASLSRRLRTIETVHYPSNMGHSRFGNTESPGSCRKQRRVTTVPAASES